MDQQPNKIGLAKGYAMEEYLRNYFLSMGYYVLRGAKLTFQDAEITDIDLWLYHRTTAISRERINVDVKFKRSPLAIERIIVAKGIMDILGNDKCIVATTDNRESVSEFGKRRGVLVLNGTFLARVRSIESERISEEDLEILLKDSYTKVSANYFKVYKLSQSRLLDKLDFISANETINDIRIVIEQVYSSPLKKESFSRLLYIIISHFLIILDYLLKEVAFEVADVKSRFILNGFRYGYTDAVSIKNQIAEVARIKNMSPAKLRESVEKDNTDILRDFFIRNDVSNHLFSWAKGFESFGFARNFQSIAMLPSEQKSVIAILCDYFLIDRRLLLSF